MDKIANEALSAQDELVSLRRKFHAYPESGWATFYTTCVIAARLKELGFSLKLGKSVVVPHKRMGLASANQLKRAKDLAKERLSQSEAEFLPLLEDGLTGLVAELDTKRAGKNIGFRFDIDAVDVIESDEPSHKPAKEGFNAKGASCMHACGHDGHIAIGLVLAELLAKNLNELNGKFRLIFQTAEEGTRGALAMKEAGVTNGLDALFGAHIGFKASKSASFICGTTKLLATTKFDINITGRSAHAAGAPQDGANALLAASQIALNLHAIPRHSGGITHANVGVLKAGQGRNVIAPNAFLACEIRGESTELNEYMFARAKEIVAGASVAYGVSYEISIAGGTSGASSDEKATEIFYNAALASPFIQDSQITKWLEFGACEDFAEFMQAVQKAGGISGYAMIGADLAAGHHNNKFDFDESALVAGVDVFLRIAYDLNGREK